MPQLFCLLLLPFLPGHPSVSNDCKETVLNLRSLVLHMAQGGGLYIKNDQVLERFNEWVVR